MNLVWHGDRAGNKVALTFDDGPKPGQATEILRVLNEEEVKASFFLVGQSAQKYPDLVYQIHSQGHDVANHSFSHRALDRLSIADLHHELIETNKILERIIGEKVRFFRPPGGRYNYRVLSNVKKQGMATIFWDINPGDYTKFMPHFHVEGEDYDHYLPQGKDVLIQNILSKIKGGSIILLHNGGKKTIEALPEIIQRTKGMGFTFVTLSELIHDDHMMNTNLLSQKKDKYDH